MGSDNDSTGPGKPSVDTDALRARLGLGPAKAPAPATQESSDQSAPPEMDPEDRTPIPQALPESSGADESVEYTGVRMEKGPLVVARLVVVLVAGAMGLILGQATSERSQLDAYNRLVSKKLKYFQEAKTASGDSMLDAIQSMGDELKLAVKAVEKLEQEEGDLLTLEPTFEALLPKLQRYKKEGVFLDPNKVMDDVIVLYADDVLLESVRFAVGTRHLFDHVSSVLGEAVATARIG
ncbi:MAG: hypothetical protein VX938_11495, partial [Myxococcota bacterium]|nr:hypothetical protein [Myxococcota bacterium]